MQLAEKNRSILVICPHPVGYAPGQRLKYEQYFDSWRKNGWHVDVSPFMSEKMQQIVYRDGLYLNKMLGTIDGYFRRIQDLFRIQKYDCIYLFLWATPFGPPIFEWLVRFLAKKIVYDIDDLVFLKNIKHENRLLGLIKGKNKPIYLMKCADYVITCTPYLNDIARKYNSKTIDISSTINTDNYLPVNKYTNEKKINIGWSGSHTTSQYLYLLKNVFLKLRDKVNFKLLVMGDPNFFIEGLDIEAVEWSESYEISFLQKIDIGVYPLPFNEEWVFGKSGLKALQYMALGIPTIATDVGCNNRIINNNYDGFLVENENEWIEILLSLIHNSDLRKKIGQSAREKVVNFYSLKATEKMYLKVLNHIL